MAKFQTFIGRVRLPNHPDSFRDKKERSPGDNLNRSRNPLCRHRHDMTSAAAAGIKWRGSSYSIMFLLRTEEVLPNGGGTQERHYFVFGPAKDRRVHLATAHVDRIPGCHGYAVWCDGRLRMRCLVDNTETKVVIHDELIGDVLEEDLDDRAEFALDILASGDEIKRAVKPKSSHSYS